MHLGATVKPAPPSRAGREMYPGVHQAGREISSDDAGDVVGVEDAAPDRTVRRLVAPRQPGAAGPQRSRDRRPNQPRGDAPPPSSSDPQSDPNRRRRRRGRGRGRGPRPGGPPSPGGGPGPT